MWGWGREHCSLPALEREKREGEIELVDVWGRARGWLGEGQLGKGSPRSVVGGVIVECELELIYRWR
jgi:hypothetical protein